MDDEESLLSRWTYRLLITAAIAGGLWLAFSFPDDGISAMGPLGRSLVEFLFLLAPIAMFWILFNTIGRARRSVGWPSAAGKITRSEFMYARDSPRNNQGQFFSVPTAAVDYEYTVGGQAYKSHRIRFGDDGGSDRVLGAYPLGKDVRVYHDPENPQLSTLEPGFAWRSFAVRLSGAIVGSTVSLLLFWSLLHDA